MAKYVSLDNLTKYDSNIKEYIGENAQYTQYDTMPPASIDNLGYIIQYTGVTGNGYTNGFFYKCISDGAATPTYSWVNISVSPQLTTATTSEVDAVTDIYDEDYVFLLAPTSAWENNPYCYMWHKNNSSSAYKPWYGEAMTLTDMTYNGQKIYKYAIPADGPYGAYNMCLFTQNGQRPLATDKVVTIGGLAEYDSKVKDYIDDTLGDIESLLATI